MIETLEDIVEQIANWCGVYGAHQDGEYVSDYCCRPCWTIYLIERIRAANEVEWKLTQPARAEGKEQYKRPDPNCNYFENDDTESLLHEELIAAKQRITELESEIAIIRPRISALEREREDKIEKCVSMRIVELELELEDVMAQFSEPTWAIDKFNHL